MSLDELRFLDDITIRCYFASLIGPSRAPFGVRNSGVATAGAPLVLTRNSTKDRALYVTVSRPSGGPAVTGYFSKNDGPSLNDYGVTVQSGSVFRFVLRPGEVLSFLCPSADVALVWGQEAY